MEKLIIIAVIVIASIVQSWIARKREQTDETAPSPEGDRRTPPAPPIRLPPPPPRPTAAGDWEDALRRLLQGDRPVTPPPAQRPVQMPAPPPPLPASRPVRPAAPKPILARSAIPVPDEGTEMEVGLPVRPVVLEQAAFAHTRAQVQTNVAERMQATAARVTSHAGPQTRVESSPLANRIRVLMANRESVQAAMVASVVLGPPRAMEPMR